MGNEFDLERAKAGEPIERLWHGEWIKANFIGLSLTHGDPIVEIWREVAGAWDFPSRSPRDMLRMAPKKMSVRYRVGLFRRSNGELYTWTADSDKEAEEYGRPDNFVCWLTDWQETEITE